MRPPATRAPSLVPVLCATLAAVGGFAGSGDAP
jgi:hypothetical protein